MPKEIYKILGQERPTDTSEKVLYTVPEKRSAIVKVTAFNHDTGAVNISVAIVPDGGGSGAPATVPKNYIVEDISIDPKKEASGGELKGITMNEFDEIRVESSVANEVSFHCYGVEIEP